MYRCIAAMLSLVAILAATGMAEPVGERYLLTDHWGGAWSDAEKNSSVPDDNLCWSAASSNVLDWTGWGRVDGLRNTDEIFQYFQGHLWSGGGSPSDALQWWFDDSPSWLAPMVWTPGGGFWENSNFHDYYRTNGGNYGGAMGAIDGFLHDGSGVATTLYNTDGLSPHVVTLWGIQTATVGGEYLGLWITDSDDNEADPDPPDLLQYYNVQYTSGRWYFQDFYGRNSYYIGPVFALAPIWLSLTPGDANGDGAVDLQDFGIVKGNFGEADGWDQGDFNGDGVMDLQDFGLFKSNFGSGQSAAVPEPATAVLLLLGAAAMFRRVPPRPGRTDCH